MNARTSDRPTTTTRRILVPAAAATIALLWVPLGLVHPHGEEMLAGRTTAWLAVHWAQLVLTPLLGLMMWHALDLPGALARIARIAVVLWVAFLAAFGAVAAIGTGLLVEGGFAEAARHLWAQTQTGTVLPVGVAAHLAWVVAAVAGGVALRARGAPRAAYGSMLVGALLMATGHGDVFSAVGAAALALALFVTLRARAEGAPWTGQRALAAAEGPN